MWAGLFWYFSLGCSRWQQTIGAFLVTSPPIGKKRIRDREDFVATIIHNPPLPLHVAYFHQFLKSILSSSSPIFSRTILPPTTFTDLSPIISSIFGFQFSPPSDFPVKAPKFLCFKHTHSVSAQEKYGD
ncbi:unnamed protein product [Citrullus colocynthis]|uniref:Uncharacterized protein n=1 Tax=Citrullus colocynthis TaxID=252529 RepID=A0ABP0YXE7_9ROSI